MQSASCNLQVPLVVDNFAGGGGASTGIEEALGRQIDLAINHDPEAIAMHRANHPGTLHLCEDVFSVDPLEVTGANPVGFAWFSPDCKDFSKAKGGKPRSKKIRALAWVMVKWAAVYVAAGLKPPAVMTLENVEEFKDWGPLLPDNTRCPRRKGNTFRNFVARLRNLGYVVEWRQLRACDYGAPTIRRRLYLISRCDKSEIVWPVPTHGDPKSIDVQSGKLKPWRTAAECIDWSIPCPSIFERKRPLAEATLRRIARGIRKFVIESADPFIVPLTHQGSDRVQSIREPFRTITGAHGGELALATAHVTKFRTGATGSDVRQPLPTITAGPKQDPAGAAHALGLVEAKLAPFLTEHANGSKQRIFAADEPLRTQCAETRGGHFAAVTAFLAKHYGGHETPGAALAKPFSAVTAKDHHAVVTSHLLPYYGTATGRDVRKPMPVSTANGNHVAEVRAFLVKYYGAGGQVQDLREPMHTIPSRDRIGLVTIKGEEYIITDIGMRMLQPRELFAAQGFPADYIIAPEVNGRPLPKHAQVRMCGNSVCPPVARAITAANVPELCAPARRVA